ncbi:MAG: glutamate synthase subunit beta [Bacteroidales bacterium]|nr:glutamate synthase subunit beta [Clostridium sp.]MCM1202886.1 glutamate synthase subunit beta [Bacteroidales bacterium]
MGKKTGFLEYDRETSSEISPKERIKNFQEFHVPLSREKQRTQAARCMECGVPFCQSGMLIGGMASGCPLNNLIPEWNDLVYHGNWDEAYERLIKTNNFPEFTSRVCPSPCEAACTCNLNGEPVCNKENERSIIEAAYAGGLALPKAPAVRTGKKIAVIGSGPAGLAAADQLNKRGHLVTVYEKSDRIGGLLMYGIPNMKLEKQIIERKIAVMKAEGVEFVTGANVGATKAVMNPSVAKEDIMGDYLTNKEEKAVKADALLKEYDSVVLACGASNPRDIKVKGREAKGIYFAVDFLKTTTKSLLDSAFKDKRFVSAKGKNVLVIGGGDTGNDCVGTAIRQGAKGVVQLEMMPKPPVCRAEDNPWPEWPKILKTDYGQEEAIAVFGQDPRIYETTVKEFIRDKDGNVTKAKCIKLEWKKDDKTGRMNMSEIEGSEYEVPCDIVLIAAGFLGSQEYVSKAFGVELNERTNVKTEAGAYATNVPKVFTAGDMHRGQSLVVWAIREGREAAKAVDAALMGYSNL